MSKRYTGKRQEITLWNTTTLLWRKPISNVKFVWQTDAKMCRVLSKMFLECRYGARSPQYWHTWGITTHLNLLGIMRSYVRPSSKVKRMHQEILSARIKLSYEKHIQLMVYSTKLYLEHLIQGLRKQDTGGMVARTSVIYARKNFMSKTMCVTMSGCRTGKRQKKTWWSTPTPFLRYPISIAKFVWRKVCNIRQHGVPFLECGSSAESQR